MEVSGRTRMKCLCLDLIIFWLTMLSKSIFLFYYDVEEVKKTKRSLSTAAHGRRVFLTSPRPGCSQNNGTHAPLLRIALKDNGPKCGDGKRQGKGTLSRAIFWNKIQRIGIRKPGHVAATCSECKIVSSSKIWCSDIELSLKTLKLVFKYTKLFFNRG